jgi:hypothetical protein
MLSFCWKFLTPLALVTVMLTAVVDKVLAGVGKPVYTIGMLITNIVIIWVTLALLRTYARIERKRVAEPGPIARPELVSRGR